MLRYLCLGVMLLLAMSLHAAEPIVVKWDKDKLGYSVVAFDMATRAIRWEVQPCPEPNFVRKTSGGILVGCEESMVLMLDPSTGRARWGLNLEASPPVAVGGTRKERGFDINGYHGEHLNAYLLSQSDEVFFLIGRNGESLVRCGGRCGSIMQKTSLYAGRLLLMRWDGEERTRGILAIDVSANRRAWHFTGCPKANFAEPTSMGILIGCDNASVFMLQPETGQTIWHRDLAQDGAGDTGRSQRNVNINRYNGEQPEGFLVSDADNVYFGLGRRGELLLRCEQQCVGPAGGNTTSR